MKEEDNNNYLTEAPKDPFTPEEKKRAKETLSSRLAQMRVQPSPGRTPPPTAPRTSAPSSPSLINITPSSVSACYNSIKLCKFLQPEGRLFTHLESFKKNVLIYFFKKPHFPYPTFSFFCGFCGCSKTWKPTLKKLFVWVFMSFRWMWSSVKCIIRAYV